MVSSLASAGARLAKAKHMLDNAWVTIKTTQAVKKGVFTDGTEPVTIVTDYPARVIKGSLGSKDQAEWLPDEYDAVLVIDTGIKVPAGCTVDAKGLDGELTHYVRATRGYAGYHSHQEIALVLAERA